MWIDKNKGVKSVFRGTLIHRIAQKIKNLLEDHHDERPELQGQGYVLDDEKTLLFYEDKLEPDKIIAIFIQGNSWDNLVSALKIINVLCISQFQAPTPPALREFFEVVKRPAPGQIFLQKHGPRDKKTGSILKDLVSFSC